MIWYFFSNLYHFSFNVQPPIDSRRKCTINNLLWLLAVILLFSFVFVQTLTMLATDAIVTVVTWLPYCGYQIYEYGSDDGHRGIFQRYSLKQNFVPHAAFTGLLLTNCFTTPVIYYMFQSAFRVSIIKWALEYSVCPHIKICTALTIILQRIPVFNPIVYKPPKRASELKS